MRLHSRTVNLQFSIASSTSAPSCLLLLFADDWDDGVVERISSVRLEDAIRERKTLSNTLKNIKLRFQKADHELGAVKIENDAQIKTFQHSSSVSMDRTSAEEQSQALTKIRAVSRRKSERESQMD